jgi:hypothetical protein
MEAMEKEKTIKSEPTREWLFKGLSKGDSPFLLFNCLAVLERMLACGFFRLQISIKAELGG